jgi:hypothetical protein
LALSRWEGVVKKYLLISISILAFGFALYRYKATTGVLKYSEQQCRAESDKIDAALTCNDKASIYLGLMSNATLEKCEGLDWGDKGESRMLKNKIFDITSCYESKLEPSDDILKQLMDTVLAAPTWSVYEGPTSFDAHVGLSAFKERWIDQNTLQCRNREDYLLFLKNALNGDLAEIKKLVFSEHNFYFGYFQSDNSGPMSATHFISYLEKERPSDGLSLIAEFSIARWVGWTKDQDLFFIPGLKNNCWYLHGAYLGLRNLTLDQVSQWVPKISGVPQDQL